MTEKQQLQETPGPAPFPPPQPPPHARTLARQRSRWVLTAFVLLAMLASVHLSSSGGLAGCLQRSASPGSHAHTEHEVGGPIPAQSIGGKAPACPAQPPALPPRTTVAWTDARRAHSAELHAQAVQHATQSYDDNGEPGEDPRWEPFHDFLRWWRDAFPVAVGKAKIEMINSECTDDEPTLPIRHCRTLVTHTRRGDGLRHLRRKAASCADTPSARHPGDV